MDKKNNNKLKFKIEGTVLTALVIAAVILVNVIFGALGNKVNMKADLTGGGVFTLAKETKEVLEANEQDIVIYYATNADSRNTRYTEILDAFSKYSNKIELKEINIDTDPGFSRTYQIRSYNSVVVECAATNKKRVIDSSLIEQSAANDNGIENKNMNYLESYVSAAIRYATSDDPLMVYISVGHGEIVEKSNFLDYLMKTLYSEAMSVKILDMTTDAVPQDADMILVAGATTDFTTEEIKKLDDFLEAGGRVQIYSNPSYSLPNLNAYLSNNWSAEIENNCVSDENASYIASSSLGNYLIPVFKEHAMTSYLMSASSKLRVQDGEINSIKTTENKNIEANVLVSTSETGITMTRENWVLKNSRQSYSTLSKGETGIMVYLRKNPLNNKETSARLLLCGSYYMLFDGLIDTSSGYADKDLIIKSINYMSGIEDAPVSVAAKAVREEKMEVLEKSKLTGCIVLLVGVIPVLLFSYGIYVYLRRKRL